MCSLEIKDKTKERIHLSKEEFGCCLPNAAQVPKLVVIPWNILLHIQKQAFQWHSNAPYA